MIFRQDCHQNEPRGLHKFGFDIQALSDRGKNLSNSVGMSALLAIFAHPDDETFRPGGDYADGYLHEADEKEMVALILPIITEVQPQVLLSLGPDSLSAFPLSYRSICCE